MAVIVSRKEKTDKEEGTRLKELSHNLNNNSSSKEQRWDLW